MKLTVLEIRNLSVKLARDLFMLGDGPTPCQRIQFLGGKYPDDEIEQGGLCESALAKEIEQIVQDHNEILRLEKDLVSMERAMLERKP